MLETNALLVSLIICVPAFIMALQQSTWLIDYLFFVVALNRGIRRIVDYYNEFFNPFSLISLTPLIIGGLATLVVLLELNRPDMQMGNRTIRTLYRYAAAVAVAFIIGFINVKFGAVYAMGDYIVPLGLIGFGALHCNRPEVMDRWCNSVALSAVLVAGYGIWQFYTIPPWDAFWVRAVNMEGYLGTLAPTKMTLFSTMAERGPAATYLCSALILLILRPQTLSIFRWPAAGLVLVAMLLTYSRTTVIQAGLACLVFPIINRGTGILPIAMLFVVFTVFGDSILSRLPGGGMAAQRVSTISNIQEDGSFIGRIRIIAITFSDSLTQPLGLGIGSHGLAARVASKASGASGDSSGYIETLRTFGWIGFFVIANILYRTWQSSSELLRAERIDRNVALFRAWFIAGMAAFFSGNWLFTATFFWVLAGYCLGQLDMVAPQDDADEFHPNEVNPVDFESDAIFESRVL